MGRRSKHSSTKQKLASVGFIIVVTLLVLLFRLVEETGPERQPGDRFLIVKVIDGDTVELQGGDRLRLLAIDTPEEGELYHDEAKKLLKSLAVGRSAKIEFQGRRRDKYGRLLGYLYIDSLFVNKVQIDSGMAYIYLFKDNNLSSPIINTLLKAQQQAIKSKVGIWSIKRDPEAVYIASAGKFRLHRPSCYSVKKLSLSNRIEYSTREEGLATGLSPCRNCKP